MRWMLLLAGTIGCYSPPELSVEVRVDIGPCGEPTRQVVMSTVPGETVSLFRDDELISEHETDASGMVTVRWPDTSLVDVQARVGRPDNYTSQDLVPPRDELYPVWREGRVAMNTCPGLANCGVSVSGATLQAHTPFAVLPQLSVDRAEPAGDSVRLTAEHLAEWRFPVIQEGEACAHLEGPGVQLILPQRDQVFEGRLWWSEQQALLAVADVAARDAGELTPTGAAVLAVETRTPVLTTPTELVRVFGELTQPSDVAAVIQLQVFEQHVLAACEPGTGKNRWTVTGKRIDVSTGETRETTVATSDSPCLGPTDVPMDPTPQIDEVIAQLSES